MKLGLGQGMLRTPERRTWGGGGLAAKHTRPTWTPTGVRTSTAPWEAAQAYTADLSSPSAIFLEAPESPRAWLALADSAAPRGRGSGSQGVHGGSLTLPGSLDIALEILSREQPLSKDRGLQLKLRWVWPLQFRAPGPARAVPAPGGPAAAAAAPRPQAPAPPAGFPCPALAHPQ